MGLARQWRVDAHAVRSFEELVEVDALDVELGENVLVLVGVVCDHVHAVPADLSRGRSPDAAETNDAERAVVQRSIRGSFSPSSTNGVRVRVPITEPAVGDNDLHDSVEQRRASICSALPEPF